MKTKSTILTLLIILALSSIVFSQSIIILPQSPAEENYCEFLQKKKVKKMTTVLNSEMKIKGFDVPDFPLIIKKMTRKGGCNEPFAEQIIMNIAKEADTDYYILYETTLEQKRMGNELLLELEIYETGTGEITASASGESGQFNTDNIEMLGRKALKKCIKELKKKLKKEAKEDKRNKYVVKDSDVDINIPVSNIIKKDTYVLIIGNEDYSGNQVGLNSEVNVDFAKHDAETFKKYALHTLGVPEQNITLITDAKALEMDGAIKKLSSLAKVSGGEAELIFYYAGHGFPDENTKEPYLMPVDVSATNLKYAIKLKDVYSKLTEFPTKRISVFLDACFSGGARNQGLLAARAVKIKPKKTMLKGDIIVFSSSSGEQSSLPYKEKYHGLFTYYLLKFMQISEIDFSYSDLSTFLKRQVGTQSINVNGKEQIPQTNISLDAVENWEHWKMNDFSIKK